MKLADIDALKQTFCAECDHSIKCEDCDIDYHFEHLAPTVDAVEVVRCKDCKYCTDCITDDGMNIYYRCLKDYEKPPYCSTICPQVDEDDYCSWGERKEDETD